MSTDDEFARRLRDRVDAAAPTIDVHLTGVVPRARRRRAWTRAAGAGAAGGLVLAGVLVGQAWAGAPWSTHTLAGPAGTGTPVATVTPEPTPDGSTAPADAQAAEDARAAAEAAADAALRYGTAQGAAPYWYTRVEATYDGPTETAETWSSTERPGLLAWDGDYTPSSLAAMGPKDVLGSFVIDGEPVEMLRDPAVLPTDAAGLAVVLRATVGDGPGADDLVYERVHDLLLDGGIRPTALLRAAVEVVESLPGATTTAGTDSRGRAGTVVEYPLGAGGVARLVVEPGTWLPLEIVAPGEHRVWVEQGPRDTVPVEPTLEIAGCLTWETC